MQGSVPGCRDISAPAWDANREDAGESPRERGLVPQGRAGPGSCLSPQSRWQHRGLGGSRGPPRGRRLQRGFPSPGAAPAGCRGPEEGTGSGTRGWLPASAPRPRRSPPPPARTGAGPGRAEPSEPRGGRCSVPSRPWAPRAVPRRRRRRPPRRCPPRRRPRRAGGCGHCTGSRCPRRGCAAAARSGFRGPPRRRWTCRASGCSSESPEGPPRGSVRRPR